MSTAQDEARIRAAQDPTPGLVRYLPAALVAGGAALATAHGLYETTAACGVGWLSWTYPVITDGLAAVAYSATTRLVGRAAGYAWTVVVFAAAVSGLAQAVYLVAGTALQAPPALRFGVGAWPAVAAAVAAHLLHLLWRADHPASAPGVGNETDRSGGHAAADRGELVNVAGEVLAVDEVPVGDGLPVAGVVDDFRVTAGSGGAGAGADDLTAPGMSGDSQPTRGVEAGDGLNRPSSDDGRVLELVALLVAGAAVTGHQAAVLLTMTGEAPVSERTGRRLLAEARRLSENTTPTMTTTPRGPDADDGVAAPALWASTGTEAARTRLHLIPTQAAAAARATTTDEEG